MAANNFAFSKHSFLIGIIIIISLLVRKSISLQPEILHSSYINVYITMYGITMNILTNFEIYLVSKWQF